MLWIFVSLIALAYTEYDPNKVNCSVKYNTYLSFCIIWTVNNSKNTYHQYLFLKASQLRLPEIGPCGLPKMNLDELTYWEVISNS